MGTSVSLANGAVGEKFAAHASGHWRIRFVDADATHTVTNGTEGRIEVTGRSAGPATRKPWRRGQETGSRRAVNSRAAGSSRYGSRRVRKSSR